MQIVRQLNPPCSGGLVLPTLIRQAQGGDHAAFEQLYHVYKRRVYSLCLRMVGDEGTAEELSQECFLQVYRKIGSFRGEAAFSTWLHRVAVNTVLMHARKHFCRTCSLDELTEEPGDGSPSLQFGTEDSTLVGSIDRLTLVRAMAELAPGYRLSFILHDIDGHEHKEIAQLLRCSIGNSKSQVHKARRRLRAIMGRAQVEHTRPLPQAA